MTIIDVLAALEKGAYPTNEQLLAIINHLLSSTLLSTDPSAAHAAAAAKAPEASPVLDRRKLSPETLDLLDEFSGLLKAIALLIKERNPHEAVQEALWRSRGAAKASDSGLMKIQDDKGKKAVQGLIESTREEKKAKIDVKQARKAVRKAQKQAGGPVKELNDVNANSTHASVHLRTVLRLILVQPTFRHVVSDVFFYLEATLEGTARATFEIAQEDLGQVSSALGKKDGIDSGVLQHAIERGEAAPLDEARLVQQAFKEKRSYTEDTLRLERIVPQQDGGIQVGPVDPEQAAKKAQKAQMTATEKAAEQLAMAQQSLTSAKEETRHLHSPAKCAVDQIQSSKNEVFAEVNGQALEAEENAGGINERAHLNIQNGSLPPDLFDAVQLATVSGIRVGQDTLGKRGEMLKLANTGKDEFVKNAKENWTPERRKRLFTRFRKLFADLQAQPDYRESIIFFIEFIEKLVPVPAEAATASSMETKTELVKRKLDAALGENNKPILEFLDNFAEGQSLLAVLQNTYELAADTIDDSKSQNAAGRTAQSFWRMVNEYMRDLLLKEGYALSSQAEIDGKAIKKHFDELSQEYKRNVVIVISGVAKFAHAIQQDKCLKAISMHATKFAKQLVIGKQGSGLPSKAIWNDMRRVILPFVFHRVGAVPIPRVRYLHPDFDVAVENVALQLKQLLPDTFDLNIKNDFHVDFRKIKESSHAHQLKIKIKGMGIRVHKLDFAFQWKKGIRFLDKGIGDLNIDGFGLSMYIDVPNDRSKHFFVVKKVKTKLNTLSLKVHQTNHRVLHAFTNSLVNNYLTNAFFHLLWYHTWT
ncbi:hypothetical protein K437DRAFT_44020 [Tilletiaria anomala UBC 951]|uniref:HAM1-like N-terminal domain-containing protein n=1 Tax=Tilletiaria anomala (strain ATCC 24038 / CBS 436.72 / UBC 951) TaxID=1037660 RepID=A0A066WHG5_TILAU|nr:uncharacterized protein K437DRAFT_44020 [Tilletiaria anomala UBC 951]KDN51953.1 hypothetical protein K437DRAFT_44020 [Tilletiaria anomala UBC 951]